MATTLNIGKCTLCSQVVSINDEEYCTAICCGSLFHDECNTRVKTQTENDTSCLICGKKSSLYNLNGKATKEAMKRILNWVKKGEQWAMIMLGGYYLEGKCEPFLKQNSTKAIEMYLQAVELGSIIGMVNLGKIYADGLGGIPQSWEKANQYYLMSADHQHADGQYQIAYNLHHGFGIDKDINKAYSYYSLSANQNNAPSQFSLAGMLLRGDGDIEVNRPRALELYQKAATQGYERSIQKCIALIEHYDPGAAYVLKDLKPGAVSRKYRQKKVIVTADLLDSNLNAILHWMKQDKTWAIYHYANCIYDGLLGVGEKDETKAYAFYEMAANKGHVLSTVNVGLASLYGTMGVQKDKTRAYKYLTVAAEKGNVYGQVELGLMYQRDRKLLLARKWWMKVIAQCEEDWQYTFSADGVVQGLHGRMYHIKDWFEDLNRHLSGSKPRTAPAAIVNCLACGTGMQARAKSTKRCPCKEAYYCNTTCQGAHWSDHKIEHKKTMKKIKLMKEKEAQENDIKFPKQEQERDDCPICQKPLQSDPMANCRMLCCGKGMHLECRKNIGISKTLTTDQKNTCALCQETAPIFGSKKEHELLSHWIQQDKVWALAQMGQLCHTGGHGVKKSRKNSFKYYEMAAKKGHITSQYNVAVAYSLGKGVTQSDDKAKEFMEMAAHQGDAEALYRLGTMYAEGSPSIHQEMYLWTVKNGYDFEKMSQNETQMMELIEWRMSTARKWLTKAADQGHKGAIKMLKIMDSEKCGTKKKKNKKKKGKNGKRR